MKAVFEEKKRIDIGEINAGADRPGFASESEAEYEGRIRRIAAEIAGSGCRIVMLSGPSGSGKTTSSLKIAKELRSRGIDSEVISLDDFFKNIADYPEAPNGEKDLESVWAVDVALVNEKLSELAEKGSAELPQFDFLTQHRKGETRTVSLGGRGVAVIEGIHALNPLLSESIHHSDALRVYAGLREEYYAGEDRVIATRDIRITRRMIRDYYFRGHSIENTLRLWGDIMRGEETWIKVFKPEADLLLDTSFRYEIAVWKPMIDRLFADPRQGGACRGELAAMAERFSPVRPVDEAAVPDRSMLREFLGGLQL